MVLHISLPAPVSNIYPESTIYFQYHPYSLLDSSHSQHHSRWSWLWAVGDISFLWGTTYSLLHCFCVPIGNIWILSFGNFRNITFSFTILIQSWQIFIRCFSPSEFVSCIFPIRFCPARMDPIQTVLVCAIRLWPLDRSIISRYIFQRPSQIGRIGVELPCTSTGLLKWNSPGN